MLISKSVSDPILNSSLGLGLRINFIKLRAQANAYAVRVGLGWVNARLNLLGLHPSSGSD